MKDHSRRDFIKKTSMSTALLAAGPALAGESKYRSVAPSAEYMGGFAAPKLERVRCAFIGVGNRGSGHAQQVASIAGAEIVAISDLYEDLAAKVAAECKSIGEGNRHQDIALYHSGPERWKEMLEEVKPDAVFISTPWKLHAPMAITCMNAGSHAFVEVPLALTTEEMWDIVDTSEKTKKHCMMMENVNYGREELVYLNMCRLGLLGEVLHAEAAYIHELRGQMEDVERGTGSWRTFHYADRNGNLYPTHGLGPVAQYMNLARGDDNFGRIVSFSSPARGRQLYANSHYPEQHKWNKLDYQGGDMNTSIIKTTMGKTIMVQWDETSPRPYTRHNLIQGTKGILAGFPNRIALEGGVEGVTKDHHEWVEGEQLEAIFEKYEHPLYKRLGEISRKMGGHGGMDFMMLYRIIECLQTGSAMDQNVYEGCFWSVVAPLSEASVKQGGAPQEFPDFTRGNWKSTEPLAVIS